MCARKYASFVKSGEFSYICKKEPELFLPCEKISVCVCVCVRGGRKYGVCVCVSAMTATLRRIDQTTMILAPIATGQVMTYIGLVYGAIFIGGWNVLSVFVELFLMWKVYNTVPALTAKKNTRRSDGLSLCFSHGFDPLTKETEELVTGF